MKIPIRPVHLFTITALIGFFILLTGESEDPLIWRYSLRYLAVLVGYGVGVAVGIVVLSRRLPLLPGAVWAIMGMAGMGLAAWLPLLDHTPYLQLALKLVLIAFTAALLWHVKAHLIHWRALALIYLMLVLAASAVTLNAFPLMHISDEGWTANVGQTFVAEGVLHSRIHQGVFGIPQRFVPVANVLPGYWFELVGAGLFQARAVAFLGGILLLAMTFTTARRLGLDRDSALLSVCVLAGSYPFVLTSHFFRLDIYLALAGMAAWYCYARSARGAGWAFGAGILLSAGVEIHQNALLLCVAAGVMLLGGMLVRALSLRRLTLTRREGLFILGGLCGAGLFITLHILPDPAEFMRQFRNGGAWRTELTSGDPGGSFRVLWDLLRKYWQASPLAFIGFSGILISAAFNPAARRLLLLIGLILLTFNFLLPSYLEYYSILFLPPIAIAVGQELMRRTGKNHSLSLVLCAGIALPVLFTAFQHRTEDLNRRIMASFESASALFKDEARVAAPQIFVFAMPHNPNLIALFMPRYAAWTHQSFSCTAVWERYQPEAFIVYGRYGADEDPDAVEYRSTHGLVEVLRITDLPEPLIVYAKPSALRSP